MDPLETVLTVTDLTLAIKKQLEHRFPFVCVKGEVSNFKEQTSGHLYFTLKDEQAQISAAFFKGKATGLSRKPKDGDKVIVRGELSVYPPRGGYQIVVNSLEYAGVGELLLKLHQLKAELEGRGWFDPSKKKPLPKIPKTIGVVTSPTGSVIQDILHILQRRFSGFHLILNPVKVQGEGAAAEIAAAIEQFNTYQLADVLIVGRGGGSLEDLWAFNEEVVAKAIFQSKIPIISAVGHETDVCIADFVADLRAPTPSAAAEIVIAEKQHHLDHLSLTRSRLKHAGLSFIRESRRKVEGMSRQAEALRPTTRLTMLRQKLTGCQQALSAAMHYQMQARKGQLFQLVRHLKAIDPKNLLTKGYCILFAEKNNSVILSIKQLEPEDKLRLLVHDGEAIVTVNEIK